MTQPSPLLLYKSFFCALTHAVGQLFGVLGEVVPPTAQVEAGHVVPEAEALRTEADVGHGHVVVGGARGVRRLHRVQLDEIPRQKRGEAVKSELSKSSLIPVVK